MLFVRRAGIVLVVVALVAGLAGAMADAKKSRKKKVRHWSSEVTLTQTASTQFRGKVSSKLKACRREREVVLYYTDPVTGQTQPLSVQRTDGAGQYEVNLPAQAYAGNYQAQLIKQRIRAKRAPQLCEGDQSGVVTVF